jgi:multicomponent Na+:H+ antiporter subunit E
MSRLTKAIAPAVLAFVAYVVFTGSIGIYDIVTGALVSIVAGIITAELVVEKPAKSLNPLRLIWLAIYTLYYLVIAETKAHLDVMYRIIHPKMPIRPGIVRAPFNVKTDYSIVAIANSITNTPGTVVVDLNAEKGVYYVHWINVKAPDPETTYNNIVKDFEKFIKRVFD